MERLQREYNEIETGASNDIKSHELRYKELQAEYEHIEEQNQQQLNLIDQVMTQILLMNVSQNDEVLIKRYG